MFAPLGARPLRLSARPEAVTHFGALSAACGPRPTAAAAWSPLPSFPPPLFSFLALLFPFFTPFFPALLPPSSSPLPSLLFPNRGGASSGAREPLCCGGDAIEVMRQAPRQCQARQTWWTRQRRRQRSCPGAQQAACSPRARRRWRRRPRWCRRCRCCLIT